MASNEVSTGITIRRLDSRDEEALQALLERDSHERPRGPLLGVDVEGRLLAAISLQSGETVADPFSRTAELRALLKLRAKQLNARERTSGLGWRRSSLALPGAQLRSSGASVSPASSSCSQ